MTENKTIIITAKVNKGIRDYSGIVSKELKPYEGKTIKFQILEVMEPIKPTGQQVNVLVSQVV